MIAYGILIFLLVIWIFGGLIWYTTSIPIVEAARMNNKYIRVALFILLCGPIVWALRFLDNVLLFCTILTYWILQEDPGENQ